MAILPPRLTQSGRLDSNQRPQAPHACTLPGCATSRNNGLDTIQAPYKVANLYRKGKLYFPLIIEVHNI